MYTKINHDAQQKCLCQRAFLAHPNLFEFRIILLFTIAYPHLKLVLVFRTMSITLNVVRVPHLTVTTFPHFGKCHLLTLWEQEKVCS